MNVPVVWAMTRAQVEKDRRLEGWRVRKDRGLEGWRVRKDRGLEG